MAVAKCKQQTKSKMKTRQKSLSVKRRSNLTLKGSKRNKTCDECPSTFVTSNGLTQHKKIHKKLEELNYKCNICGETFHDAEKFRKHMFMHDVKLYKCESCGASFKYLQSYTRHLKDYPDPHFFPCDHCKRSFKRLVFLNKHVCNLKDKNLNENEIWSSNDLENSNDNEPISQSEEGNVSDDLFQFKCKECNWMFSSEFNLKRHLEIYSDKHFLFPCCGNQLKKNSDIMSHVCSDENDKDLHDQIMTELKTTVLNISKIDGKRIYTCNICSASFFRLHSLKRHLKKNEGQHNFYCKFCVKRYPNQKSFDTHLCPFKDNQPLQCSCMEVFESMKKFQHHIGDKRPYTCCACKMETQFFGNLVNHIRTHTKEKPWVCSFCNKSFAVKTALTIHVRVHTGEKTYKCSKCSYCTVTKWNLGLHEKKHELNRTISEKKFLCTQCGLGFYLSHHLKKHLITHNPTKDHKCNICGKAFGHREYLQKHLKKCHEIYKCSKCNNQQIYKKDFYQHYVDTGHFSFVCDPCEEVFLSKTKLSAHLNRFHSKFACTECSKKFSDRENLEKHYDKYHKESEKKVVVLF